jgi:hypothetical protein
MTLLGARSSVAGSLAARRVSWSAEVRSPGMIAPPRNRASPVTQSKVVAVPKSTTMLSALNNSTAASTFTIRSAPTVSGSSTSSLTGSGLRASISSPVQPVILTMPSTTLWVTVGATDARHTARTSLGE